MLLMKLCSFDFKIIRVLFHLYSVYIEKLSINFILQYRYDIRFDVILYPSKQVAHLCRTLEPPASSFFFKLSTITDRSDENGSKCLKRKGLSWRLRRHLFRRLHGSLHQASRQLSRSR